MPETRTVEEWLAREIGLDARSLGPRMVADAVRQRMAACRMDSEADYLSRLHSAPEEQQALIESVVVPETWFFRDTEPFAYLGRHVASAWLPAHPRGHLRILSVPCSSGEEPYSIAMALQEAGVPAERYRIDAVDISHALLRKAAAAVYGPHSFRGMPPDLLHRYFAPEGHQHRLRLARLAPVRFAQGNIMAPDFLSAAEPYDILFHRNLLIYQHAEARRQIVTRLDRLWKANGLLFVGHAEILPVLSERYDPIRPGGVFAYRKSPAPRENSTAVTAFTVTAIRATEPPPATSLSAPAGAVAVAGGPWPSTPGIDEAKILADQGRLGEAAALCEAWLKNHNPDPRILVLLGIIRETEGETRVAEELMNRALYLDGDCYDALMHLSLLKKRAGDTEGAERLRQRAARASRSAASVET